MPITDWIGTYTAAPAVAYAGMIAEGQGVKDVASKRVTTATVGFGRAVGRGAADGTAQLAGTGFEGITVADKSQPDDLYGIGVMAGVMRKGTIWVTASTAVTPADPVTFTAATGVIGAGLATTIAGAKFETTAAIGALVRVYLG
ncbi:MAG: structural cement protein Gp24 [Beijerinckiaceae bacterium]